MSERTLETLGKRFGPSYRWLVTITAIIGTLSTILASTIVNVALPDVMGAFGIGQDHAQLLSTGFLAAVTGTMLLNAWFTESFGYRATYAGAVVIFLTGSVVSGFAPNEGLLILGRILQGASAGMMQPLGTQIIFQVFPPEKRGSAMGIAAVGIVLAPALGPTLGGVMVDNYGWRSVFFLSVPPALIGVALAMVFMPDRAEDGPRRRFDAPGFALLLVALLALFTGLSSGQREGWGSNRVLVELGLAGLAAALFLGWEMRTPAPLMNPRVFANRGFAAAFAVALVYGASIFGTTYLIPLFVQTIQGYTATRAGLVLMPAGLIMVVVFPIAGRLADRIPVWQPVVAGLLLFALSCWLLRGVDTDTPFWTMALWIMVGRIGLGLTMPSMNAGALRALPPRFLGQGAGGINFARQFGGALGVNLLSVVLEQHTELHAQSLTPTQNPGNSGTQEFLRLTQGLLAQDGVPETERLAGAYNFLSRTLQAQSSMLAFRDSFLWVSIACALAVLPALATRRRAKPA
ncbi:EmrB/QacA family drug resistance transporter [Siccirubricoccus deserti]|uniref:DHA2 family efflux MFS transporter permease subunit n=1 Tax=Siccirubricoccus deserti TaxID=2013562 RepID=A0A9X0UGD3_9PROT|nr:DHA2 family efflux MFS transporter permease subunit [Siccirubricoccus deserti]MBC4015235.1 DHA2 family efflux MFS transporter permease subunit [Siccirubricoccus deserti]GGC37941.1 EmrB/QacA family drug resistance transporter [Siccirubricoccus deserti]